MIHLKSSGLPWGWENAFRAGAWGPTACHPVGTGRRQHLIFIVSFSASTAPSTAHLMLSVERRQELLCIVPEVQVWEKVRLQH